MSEWLYTIIPESSGHHKALFFSIYLSIYLCIYTVLEIMSCSYGIHFTTIGNNPSYPFSNAF